MLQCPKCARSLSDNDRFCPACGAALVTPTSAPTEISAGSSAPDPSVRERAFTPGTMLAQRYRIVAFVGRGGMGEVYRADDLRLGETVALKFLPEDVARDPARRKRFDEEVRLARAISHPNVCRVYDVGEADGRTFLSMEYVDGEDLVSLLRRIGRLPGPKGVEIARQLCAGLAAAHGHGVLHRDLKPANVMIDGRGHAKITDFGLAVTEETAEGQLDGAGTPAYMAPEQLEGKPATVRSDLYALGLVVYEVFTGKRAFEASSIAGWREAHASSIPSRPSSHVADLDPAAEKAMLRCLEKDPARRPSSASQLAAMLPGGDPLAAALAAGETPSPELVAASAEEGTLPLARASAWLALTLVALAIFAYASSRYGAFNLLTTLKEPAVLEDNAREMLRALGYPSRPAWSIWFTYWDREAARAAPSLAAIGSMQPSPGVFGYRESPQRLESTHRGDGVGFADPPPFWSGEARVATDMNGRLLDLVALPDELDASKIEATAPDWDVPFRFAGLDRSAFKETSPQWATFVPADERRAWVGLIGTHDVRIEGASWRGRVDRFSVVLPWDRSERMNAYAPTGWARYSDTLWIVLILVALATVSVLARRNHRHGRADARGAAKMAWAIVAICCASIVLVEWWAVDAQFIFLFIVEAMGISLFAGGSAWLAYMGLEPYLRRNAPHRLIAWTRLLGGRWRDPLVGREMLWGVALAASIAAARGSAWIVGGRLGLQGLGALTESHMRNAPGFWSDVLTYIFVAILNAWVCTAVLLVLKIVLRKDIAVWIAFGLLLAGSAPAIPLPGLATIPVLIALGLAFVIAFRIGQLCGVVTFVAYKLLGVTPLVTGRWYAWRGYVIVAIVVALAIVGFRVAIGKRALFAAKDPTAS